MSSNRSLVTRYFEEMSNGRKLDAADEIFAAAHDYHDPSSPGIGPGPEGMKQLLSVYHTAFPDSHWTVDEMMEAGDRVISVGPEEGFAELEALTRAPAHAIES